MLRKPAIPGAMAAALAVLAAPAHADWGLNMTEGVTTLSGEIYCLHMLIFWVLRRHRRRGLRRDDLFAGEVP